MSANSAAVGNPAKPHNGAIPFDQFWAKSVEAYNSTDLVHNSCSSNNNNTSKEGTQQDPPFLRLFKDATLARHLVDAGVFTNKSSNDSSAGKKSSIASQLLQYAMPPPLTTFRIVGWNKDASSSSSSSAASSNPRELRADLPYFSAQLNGTFLSMEEYHLPEAFMFLPAAPSKEIGGGGSGSLPPQEYLASELAVVVDAGCAEAVLRGSDVFAPGILASAGKEAHWLKGQKCIIVYDPAGGLEQQQQQQKPPKAKEGDGKDTTTEAEAAVDGDEKGAGKGTATTAAPKMVHKYLRGAVLGDIENFVIVGAGTMTMDRTHVYHSGKKGIGIQNEWNPFRQPSRSQIVKEMFVSAATVNAPTNEKTTGGGREEKVSSVVTGTNDEDAVADPLEDCIFLQNFSSMIPVALMADLMKKKQQSTAAEAEAEAAAERKHFRLCDMCAAPGGKSSHWIERMVSDSLGCSFELVCCERSKTRSKQLEKLLVQHHKHSFGDDNDAFSKNVSVHCGDSNKLLRAKDFRPFDAILLDPPCTGLGLRPRLNPHPHTVDDVKHSADYQRKLLDSAVALLRPPTVEEGGFRPLLSYSTCTISVEEDEANVLYALEQYCSTTTPTPPTSVGGEQSRLQLKFGNIRKDEALQRVLKMFGNQDNSNNSSSSSRSTCPVGGHPLYYHNYSPQLSAAIQRAKEQYLAAAATTTEEGDGKDWVPWMFRFGPVEGSGGDENGLDSVGFFVAIFERIQ